ncbi:MAG: hypothetical protein QOE33_3080 [Acidobacteriota bacterium]|nr:hypothetical protein [Acidobacteriota bacterium]
MSSFKSIDEIAGKAFALAYFIHGNRVKAISIVREALGKLEVAAAAQVKRLYYTPARRSLLQRTKPASHRTKVSLSDLHLLQRLIYVESEPHEKERERRPDTLREEELLIHFIKYLIRISIKRNSFYVALGVSRLLHNYSTNETMEIYNVVVQDPERVKDDYYYRSRKGRLIQEIKDRFGDLINVSRGSRGEERFQTHDAPDRFIELVTECLNQFSPWQTPCLIPARYDPTTDEISTLSSAHHGEEDTIEINRIHAVVHPDCYEQITGSLKLGPPALRLSIPHFILPNGKNDMQSPNHRSRRPPPSLDSDEMDALKRSLCEQSARRKTTHASLLSVVVDKVERARLDLQRADSIGFVIDDADELIEVRALDGGEGTLLAAHLLGGDETGGFSSHAKSEIVLEGGQRLTFELSCERNGPDEDARAFMAISYRETAWLRATALSWRRMMLRMTEADSINSWREGSFVKPALAAMLIVICAVAVARYALRDTRTDAPAELAANVVVSTQNGEESSKALVGSQASTQDAVNVQTAKKPSRNVTRQVASSTQTSELSVRPHQLKPVLSEAGSSRGSSDAQSFASAEMSPRNSDATRSVDSNVGATALSKVRKVFVDVSGDRDLSEQTALMLASSLRESQRLISTQSRDEADAAFKIKVSARVAVAQSPADKGSPSANAGARLITVSVRLVNEDGEIIWPTTGKAAESHYNGTIKDVADRITKDLLSDVLKSDAQR